MGLLRHSPLPRVVNYNENENKNKDGDKTVARQRSLLSNEIDKVSRLSRSLPLLSPSLASLPPFPPLKGPFPFPCRFGFYFLCRSLRSFRFSAIQKRSTRVPVTVFVCVCMCVCQSWCPVLRTSVCPECVLLIVFHLTVKVWCSASLRFFYVMACIKANSFAAQLSIPFWFPEHKDSGLLGLGKTI